VSELFETKQAAWQLLPANMVVASWTVGCRGDAQHLRSPHCPPWLAAERAGGVKIRKNVSRPVLQGPVKECKQATACRWLSDGAVLRGA